MKKNFLYALIGCLILLAGCSTTSINNIIIESSEYPSTIEADNSDSNKVISEVPESDLPSTEASHSKEKSDSTAVQTEPDEYDYVLIFPSDSYPETALHIYNAVENGHSDVCTIDREGAEDNRKESLKGIETKAGYDRDEWPMAMCAEGGLGASVAYIDASDNRGAGSWVGHQLSAYENGERVLFIVEKPKLLFGEGSEQSPTTTDELNVDGDIVYNNCTEAREAGVTPLFEGEAGYSKKLDRDGDGIACEA